MSILTTMVMGRNNTEIFGGKEKKKFMVQATIVLLLIFAFGIWFKQNYRFGAPKNHSACIDGHFFITNIKDLEPVRNGIFKYEARGIDTLIANEEWREPFADGAPMMKFLRGMPGDTVKVTTERVFINGEPVEGATGLALYKTLGQETPDHFHTTLTLAEDEYFFLGTSDDSYDSRYWGPVKKDQIQGRAYVLVE